MRRYKKCNDSSNAASITGYLHPNEMEQVKETYN